MFCLPFEIAVGRMQSVTCREYLGFVIIVSLKFLGFFNLVFPLRPIGPVLYLMSAVHHWLHGWRVTRHSHLTRVKRLTSSNPQWSLPGVRPAARAAWWLRGRVLEPKVKGACSPWPELERAATCSDAPGREVSASFEAQCSALNAARLAGIE